MFVLTYELRHTKVKKDLFKNKKKLMNIMLTFKDIGEKAEEEEIKVLMEVLINKLKDVVFEDNSPPRDGEAN